MTLQYLSEGFEGALRVCYSPCCFEEEFRRKTDQAYGTARWIPFFVLSARWAFFAFSRGRAGKELSEAPRME
jgi:hypothetical protein